jgi:hypothetical protein
MNDLNSEEMYPNKPPESAGKNGQQIGRENAQRVRDYVAHLKKVKRPLPSRGSKPNWTAIALACQLKGRGVLYENDEARRLIEEAVNDPDVGLESKLAAEEHSYEEISGETLAQVPVEGGRIAYTQRQLDVKQRRVQELEERLAERDAAYEAIKRENTELKERLRKYELFEEVMTTNGRRYIP